MCEWPACMYASVVALRLYVVVCRAGERPSRVQKVVRLRVNEDETVIRGVTSLGDRNYVVFRLSNVIAVFISHQPFRRLQDIVVRGLLFPFDIAASVNYLFHKSFPP